MRLTSFTDYSLRVLMYLAADPDRRATIGEIAQAFGISENHLVKVVHFLGQAGLLTNVRGRGGGIELAKSPESINVGEVVRAAEGGDVPAECFDRHNNACVLVRACQLRGALAEAIEAFYGALDRYSLASITQNDAALRRMLKIKHVSRTSSGA